MAKQAMTLDQKRAMAREHLARRQRARQATEARASHELPAFTRQTYDQFLASTSQDFDEARRFHAWVETVRRNDSYLFEIPRSSAQRTTVNVGDGAGGQRELLSFSSYNYLGLGYHPEVIAGAKRALDRFGLGACSSPVISGTFSLHRQLERELERFFELPDRGASLFSSGYGVNTGTIAALCSEGHHVVLDRAAHMSLLEGAKLSGANIHYFRHNDPDHLDRLLTRIEAGRTRTLVCTEGVFSADGDFGALADVVAVAKRHRAKVLVDEAHSIGVAGARGRGVCEAAGVLEDVDLIVVTFSKAFGGVGGALVARREIVQYVNWYAKCRMFSCALDPAVTGGILVALELMQGPEGAARRGRVLANAGLLRDQLRPFVDIGESESWVIPVLFGSEKLTLPLNRYLHERGLDTSIMQFPAVDKNESRIRLFVTSEHTAAQIDQATGIIRDAAARFGFGR